MNTFPEATLPCTLKSSNKKPLKRSVAEYSKKYNLDKDDALLLFVHTDTIPQIKMKLLYNINLRKY